MSDVLERQGAHSSIFRGLGGSETAFSSEDVTSLIIGTIGNENDDGVKYPALVLS